MDEACIIMCVKVLMEIPHVHCGRDVLIYYCGFIQWRRIYFLCAIAFRVDDNCFATIVRDNC